MGISFFNLEMADTTGSVTTDGTRGVSSVKGKEEAGQSFAEVISAEWTKAETEGTGTVAEGMEDGEAGKEDARAEDGEAGTDESLFREELAGPSGLVTSTGATTARPGDELGEEGAVKVGAADTLNGVTENGEDWAGLLVASVEDGVTTTGLVGEEGESGGRERAPEVPAVETDGVDHLPGPVAAPPTGKDMTGDFDVKASGAAASEDAGKGSPVVDHTMEGPNGGRARAAAATTAAAAATDGVGADGAYETAPEGRAATATSATPLSHGGDRSSSETIEASGAGGKAAGHAPAAPARDDDAQVEKSSGHTGREAGRDGLKAPEGETVTARATSGTPATGSPEGGSDPARAREDAASGDSFTAEAGETIEQDAGAVRPAPEKGGVKDGEDGAGRSAREGSAAVDRSVSTEDGHGADGGDGFDRDEGADTDYRAVKDEGEKDIDGAEGEAEDLKASSTLSGKGRGAGQARTIEAPATTAVQSAQGDVAARPAARATDPVPADPAEVYEQFDEGVRISLARGGKEVQIKLHPESLGKLNIRLSLNDAAVTARIVVDNPAVKALFDGDSSRVREMFASQGLSLDDYSVELSADSKEGFSSGGGGRYEAREGSTGDAEGRWFGQTLDGQADGGGDDGEHGRAGVVRPMPWPSGAERPAAGDGPARGVDIFA